MFKNFKNKIFYNPAKTNKGFATLVAAMTTVVIISIGAGIMMTDIDSTVQMRNHHRLYLTSYSLIEDFALQFRTAYELGNPPIFRFDDALPCPAGSTEIPPAVGGWKFCQPDFVGCPATTTQITIGSGAQAYNVCLNTDIDGNGGGPALCNTLPNGKNYCLDTGSMETKIEKSNNGEVYASLELPMIDKTKKIDKFKEFAYNKLESFLIKVGLESNPIPTSYAQSFFTAKPNSPPIGATTNTATLYGCPGGGAPPNACIRCRDDFVRCVQIKMCLPPDCTSGTAAERAARTIYQRIAILQPPPPIPN